VACAVCSLLLLVGRAHDGRPARHAACKGLRGAGDIGRAQSPAALSPADCLLYVAEVVSVQVAFPFRSTLAASRAPACWAGFYPRVAQPPVALSSIGRERHALNVPQVGAFWSPHAPPAVSGPKAALVSPHRGRFCERSPSRLPTLTSAKCVHGQKNRSHDADGQ
jgi:hypothetical protein